MIVKTREMGMTHRDFFRTFPAVARGAPWRQDGNKVVLGEPDKQVSILMGPESERRIALLTIPTVKLRFEFEGFDDAEAGSFMARFDLAFRRGGG